MFPTFSGLGETVSGPRLSFIPGRFYKYPNDTQESRLYQNFTKPRGIE